MENYCVSSTLKNSIFLRIQQSMVLIQILFHTTLHNTHTLHRAQSTEHRVQSTEYSTLVWRESCGMEHHNHCGVRVRC